MKRLRHRRALGLAALTISTCALAFCSLLWIKHKRSSALDLFGPAKETPLATRAEAEAALDGWGLTYPEEMQFISGTEQEGAFGLAHTIIGRMPAPTSERAMQSLVDPPQNLKVLEGGRNLRREGTFLHVVVDERDVEITVTND